MRQVIVQRVVRCGILATTIFAVCVATAAAQDGDNDGGRETQVRILGGTTRFSGPMHNVDQLHAMVNANRDQLNTVLAMAGLRDVSAQVLDALATGTATEERIAPGTHMMWMALKRSGRPALLQNVRWM